MQLAVREGLELGASELQVQRPNHSVVFRLFVLFLFLLFLRQKFGYFFLRKACELYQTKLRKLSLVLGDSRLPSLFWR